MGRSSTWVLCLAYSESTTHLVLSHTLQWMQHCRDRASLAVERHKGLRGHVMAQLLQGHALQGHHVWASTTAVLSIMGTN
jgi:hypothetical protein